MARRRGTEITVDVFNFLGVVKNLMGVLMIIIIGLAVGAAESGGTPGGGDEPGPPEPAEEVRQPPPPPKIEIPAGYTAEDAMELVEMIAQAVVVQKLVRASADHPDPERELKDMTNELSAKLAERARLRQQAAHLKIVPQKTPAKYQLAGGTATGPGSLGRFNAAFIECNEFGLVIHPLLSRREGLTGLDTGTVVIEGDLQRIRRGDITRGPRFRSYLSGLAEQGVNGVVFLIRPDGVGTYRLAQSVVDELKIRSERLAIPGFEPIDLGTFAESGR